MFSARELSVLNQIATVVSAASSISEVYASFAALVADVIGWDGIIVTTPNDDGRTFTVTVREGETTPGRTTGTVLATRGTLHGETMKVRRTLYLTADEGQTAELALRVPGLRHPLLAGFRSFLASPLLSQGEVVGVISLQSFEPHAFSDHDRTLLERIAVFIGPTVGRFRVDGALKRDDLRNKSLLKIGRLLLSVRDFGDVFEQFVEDLRTVVDVDRLTISVAQPDSATVIDRYMYGVPVPGYEVDRVIPVDALEPDGLDVNSHGYVFAENSMRDADPVSSHGLYANYQVGLRSAMFAGLRSGGRLVGTINVKSLAENAYGATELEYFVQAAYHAAASIERTLARESEIEMDRVEEGRVLARQEERRAIDVIRAKQHLLSSASQELRTPLTGILAFVDLLARNREGNLDEKQARYLSIIRRNAEDLSGMVDSLIGEAEVKTAELHMNSENFDIAAMLRDAVTDAIPRLAVRGQLSDVRVGVGIEMTGDRRQLTVAVGQLIENASRLMPSDTTVNIRGCRTGGSIELSVSVSSAGGPNECTQHGPTGPFETGDGADAIDRPGGDRSLTYARAVVAAHGGEVVYRTTPDGDLAFTIRIPEEAGPEPDILP